MSRVTHVFRRRVQPWALASLVVIWVMLWGELSWGNVFAGLILGLGILLTFPLPPITLGVRVHPWPFLVLVARFNFDLVKASIQVAYRAVAPWWKPQGRLLRVPLRSDNDLICVVTAEMTALVPGTVVLDVSPAEKWLLIHVFHAPDEEALRKAGLAVQEQEIRVIKALSLHKKHILAGKPIPMSARSAEELDDLRRKAEDLDDRTRAEQPQEAGEPT